MKELIMSVGALPCSAAKPASHLWSLLGRGLALGADAIHELPYQLAIWCRLLPTRAMALVHRRHLALAANGTLARAAVILPLAIVCLGVLFATADRSADNYNYLFLDGNGTPRTINATPDFGYRSDELLITNEADEKDAQMILTEGETVTIDYHGKLRTVEAKKDETISHMLKRVGVVYDPEEMIMVDISGDGVAISFVDEYVHTRDKVIPTEYKVKHRKNPMLPKGESRVVRRGAAGNIVKTYEDTYTNSELVDTELVHQTKNTAVTKIVEHGTMVDEVSRDDRIESVHYNKDGSGYLLFRSGDTMSFSQQVTSNATAYSIGNWTASGRPTQVGNIAVDPSVFPYGTRFYIYTNDGYLVYGNAVAADCGGAIKGTKIDLWFDSYAEACAFGRRDCTVFVLD